jgi:hypothetical protein
MAGTGYGAGVGGAGSGTRTAVTSVGSVGGGSSSGGGSVSPPSSPALRVSASGGEVRRQPDPPSNGSGDGVANAPPVATSRRQGSSASNESVSSARTVAPGPASTASTALSSIGGEPLAGSGFETQVPRRGFAPSSIRATEAAAAPGPASSSPSIARGANGDDAVPGADIVEAAPGAVADQRGSSAASDVASVGSTGPANPQTPPTARGKSALSRAADQVRGLRRRLGSLPADAAPHATPPRIPIDHEE